MDNQHSDEFVEQLAMLNKKIDAKFNLLGELLAAQYLGILTIQGMQEESFCTSARMRERYKVIKLNARKTLEKRFNTMLAGNLVHMEDAISVKEKQIEKLTAEVKELKELKEKKAKNERALASYQGDCDSMNELIDKYKVLIAWFERLVVEVPQIRKQNSGLIREQTWDSALADFLCQNPKPEKPLLKKKRLPSSDANVNKHP